MIVSAKSVSEGLKILLAYEPEASAEFSEDGFFFIGVEAKPLSKSDETKLKQLGWRFDEDADAWRYKS